MDIRTIAVELINAAAYNPRIDLQPGDPAYEKLKRSIDEFGYIDPIVWNERTGNMVGGHQRYKILVKDLGWTEIEVSVVDMELEQEKLLNIALNKVGGDWDDEALSRLIAELQACGADTSLSGLDSGEIERLIDDFRELSEDQLGDFGNRELDTAEFDEDRFSCKCPRCGFVFDSVGEDAP
ncbi:transcriptional regulator [Paenibacillus elgii]|uniref:Transcriptional regulator n=1 Tax=Paenibacillus elgii TaxID=189691 RepID=A0A161S422_9BACL|nr:ParB N-terminal domain-containing protein [Paenibacillus elgii]KZE79299.1 transcriptional regulator [Paenibacillus elgii]